MKMALRYLATHLCGLDGRGYVVIVKTVKTRKAAAKFSTSPLARQFVVTSHVVIDASASDHGTVYFMDANGEMMEPPANA